MAALTPAQLVKLRQQIGDPDENQYGHLEDLEIQEEYDEAVSDMDTAVVFCLRRRLGLAAKWTDRSGEVNSETRSQRWEHLLKLLDYWEQKTGLSGGAIFAGTMDLGLDEDEA